MTKPRCSNNRTKEINEPDYQDATCLLQARKKSKGHLRSMDLILIRRQPSYGSRSKDYGQKEPIILLTARLYKTSFLLLTRRFRLPGTQFPEPRRYKRSLWTCEAALSSTMQLRMRRNSQRP